MVSLLPNPALPSDPSTHMVVCGDDGLAHRLAAELRGVYREQVILVVPPAGRGVRQPVVGRARAVSAALFGRVVTAVNNRDVPVVQVVVVFAALVFVVANLVVDLVYPLIDRRITLARTAFVAA